MTDAKRDPTIYDVAARAGVSISTVSLALNRPGRVGAATRARVVQAIEELRYMPRTSAVLHARHGLARIGVVAPFTSYPSYGRRLNGVLEVLGHQDTDLTIYNEESAAASASPLQSALPLRGRFDGLIVMGLPLSEELADRLHDHGLPTVMVDSPRSDFTSITIDDELAGHTVGRHLLERGHTRIAFVAELQRSQEFVSQGQRRLAGLRRAVDGAGLPASAVRWITVDNDIDGGSDAAAQILERLRRPTAVFAHHDLLAAGVLREVRRRELQAPRDLAVVGFDDGDVAAALGLTTVRQPLEESGRVAARALAHHIENPTAPAQQITLPLELVVRESS